MNNQITLKTINDLLELNFFIPSYQRGYRWSEQQVKDLLNDIWEFTNKPNKQQGEFYCLQPIVVKKCTQEAVETNKLQSETNDNTWYEVIDGQQRLTTIFLLIHYFNEMWVGKKKISELKITYETRSNNSDFLNNIFIDNGNVESSDSTDSSIDYHFISSAYQTIDTWVEQKGNFDNNAFQSRFKNDTQVIWYELSENDDPIDSFIRLNVGKIPLSNAELIKAMFLQERNFGSEVELRQLEIAKEWDSMEYALQNDDFWAFLNETDSNIPARIEFLFDVMYKVARKEDEEADKKYGSDQYATFRFFYNKFAPSDDLTKSVINSWNEIKDYFSAFEDWFKDNEWYHYIGYLIWCGTSIVDIYLLYKESSKTKFKEELITLVRGKIGNIEYSKGDDGNCMVKDLSYDTDKKILRSLLLLYNIEFILQKKEYDYYRFPFNLFKSEKWDIEHISSQTTNELKDKTAQDEWLKNAIDALDDDAKKEYDNDPVSSATDFEAQRNWIIKKVGEEDIEGNLKKCIGNLTLLNAKINRSYGNAIFPAKRKEIIEHDKNGSFIPLCTKNVFLKYLTGGNNLRWTEDDIKKSMNHFVDILSNYLKEKENNE